MTASQGAPPAYVDSPEWQRVQTFVNDKLDGYDYDSHTESAVILGARLAMIALGIETVAAEGPSPKESEA